MQPISPEGNQSWIFIGRTGAEGEAPILWPPAWKNWLVGKDPEAGKDWRQEEKGAIEDEMVGWHHQINGHEFEQALGVGDGQGSLECCSPWGCKELDMTEHLNWTDWHQIVGTSRAVLWLRSTHQLQGAWVRSLVRELKSYVCAHTHTNSLPDTGLWCCFFFFFLKKLHTVLYNGFTNLRFISTNIVGGFSFLYTLSSMYCL